MTGAGHNRRLCPLEECAAVIYRFKSKAGADVIYLGDAGVQILSALGREALPQGIILAAELASARLSLQAAVDAEDQAFERQQAEALARGEPPPRRAAIGLRQRAVPLQHLLEHSQREKVDVVWNA